MSEQRFLARKSLDELLARLIAAGKQVVAPVRSGERVDFAEVDAAGKIALDYVQTVRSPKEVLFPRYERMLRHELRGKDVQVEELKPEARPTVLFGVHPCDAASLATLKAVFTWDSADAYFEPKLAALTVIGLVCTRGDAFCFCTSVGGAPGDTRGSDLLLTPLDADRYLVEVLTAKGAAVVELAPQLFTPARGADREAALARIAPQFQVQTVSERLPALFGRSEAWVEQSLRCIGCGACAYVCPTCSCFDIQDERQRYTGVRLRCWDSCGLGLFTLHASGHNPRSRQSERWRQRVMHKFSYQPQRLNVLGCVGCGRCSRACPADMNLAEHLKSLAEMSV